MTNPKPANYLLTQRKKWGLSQPELGILLGVTKSAISKYERGISAMPAQRLMACEIIFGVPAAKLLVALRYAVEDKLARRALKLDERVRGKTDAASAKKLKLLDGITGRMHEAQHDL